jgi:hypothetical protein
MEVGFTFPYENFKKFDPKNEKLLTTKFANPEIYIPKMERF